MLPTETKQNKVVNPEMLKIVIWTVTLLLTAVVHSSYSACLNRQGCDGDRNGVIQTAAELGNLAKSVSPADGLESRHKRSTTVKTKVTSTEKVVTKPTQSVSTDHTKPVTSIAFTSATTSNPTKMKGTHKISYSTPALMTTTSTTDHTDSLTTATTLKNAFASEEETPETETTTNDNNELPSTNDDTILAFEIPPVSE